MNTNTINQFKANAQQASQLLKALGHPERLLILCQLVEGEKNVGDLLQFSTLSQSAFSQQLAVLRREGLVETRKEAQVVYYRIVNPNAERVLALMHDLFCDQ